MRTSATFLICTLSALGLEACEGCNDTTVNEVVTEGESEFTNDAGSWLSMAVTPDGAPAVAYYDRTMDALGYAVGSIQDDGTVKWTREEVDSYPDDNGLNPGDAGKYASLAIAGDGQVWIAYQDASNGTMKYAHKADGTWDVAMADAGQGATPDGGYWASLALDASGNPVAAHHDNGKGNMRVAHWNGASWTGEVAAEGEAYDPPDTAANPDTVDADVGEYARIAIASDGTEYIAFYDRAQGDLKLATGKAGAYSVETIDSDGDVGQWPSIAFDGSTTWIAYQDAGNQDLKVAQGSPGNWSLQTVDEGDHAGADTHLFVDDGAVGVVYFDGFNNDMKLARLKDGAWSSETVAGSTGALGYHNESVRIGSARYAGCYDFTARNIYFTALP